MQATSQVPSPLEAEHLSQEAFVGAQLQGCELRHKTFQQCTFKKVDLRAAKLEGSRFVRCRFEHSILRQSLLDGCEFIACEFMHCDLSESQGQRAGFNACSFEHCKALGSELKDCSFQQSSMQHCDFSGSQLQHSRLVDTHLQHSQFDHTKLQHCDLSRVDVEEASFIESDFRGARLKGVLNFKEARWDHADIRDIDFTGAYLLRRHIMDENYLLEFREQSRFHRFVYRLWWISSDCGRSGSRWAMWTFAVCVLFAMIYTQVDIDFGENPTLLSPLYFSVVTLTTLGYGDVLPISAPAQSAVIFEVVIGYMALGGLLGIFGNKMARRAG